MDVFRQPPTSKGSAQTFTGDVWVDPVYTGPRPGQARLAVARFAPGARTHWHSRRLGQTLHILDGTGLLGSRDGTVIEAHPSPRTRRCCRTCSPSPTCCAPATTRRGPPVSSRVRL
jgi:hypothetical protein